MRSSNWREHNKRNKPLVNTGRKGLELKKCPDDLDFHKTIGGTTYVVQSHFDKHATECLTTKVARLVLRGDG